MRYITRHLLQYILVVLVVAVGIASLWLLEKRSLKIMAMLAFSGLYFVWGVVHHLREEELNFSVVLEYLILSALIFFILLSLA